MKLSVRTTISSVSLLLLSLNGVAFAGNDSEGVEVDISQIDIRAELKRELAAEEAKMLAEKAAIAKQEAMEAAAAKAEQEAIEAATAMAAQEAIEAEAARARQDAIDAAAAKAARDAKAVEVAAAAKEKSKEILDTVVSAFNPKETVPALSNDRLSLYLSQKVVFGQYERALKRFDNARGHLGLLVSEERDTVIQGGLALDTSLTESFRLSVGARGYGALLELENSDVFSAAIGAETAYKLPFNALPLELGASFYIAPDILTFGAADQTIDTQIDVTLPVRSQLSVFGGVRFLQFDTRPGDQEVDNRVHFGLRWDFDQE